MSTKEKSSQLQTIGIEAFGIEYLNTITNNFSKELIIGGGGFGTVYKAKHNGKFIAVKRLLNKPADVDAKLFQNEVFNVMRLSHPNIVRLIGYCSTTVDKATKYQGTPVLAGEQHRLICFEYHPNGSLDKYIDAYVKDKSHVPWNKRYNIIKGICRGLHYLHREGILHLDLKPANVLLDERMIPKIADFGLSRLRPPANEEPIHTQIIKGTLGYLAPELIDDKVLNFKTDIYSLGVIIMEIISGKRDPTNEQLDKAVLAATSEGMSETSLTLLDGQIRKCFQLARVCMDKEPKNRPDTKRIIEDLGISEDAIEDEHMSNNSCEVDPGTSITMTDIESSQPEMLQAITTAQRTHVAVNIDSSEADPSSENGIHQRHKMAADIKSSTPEGSSSATAVTVRTRLPGMMAFLWRVPVPSFIALLLRIGFFGSFLFLVLGGMFKIMIYYDMLRTVSIKVEEASFTRFALATSSPVLTYNLSALMMIINYQTVFLKPTVTKPLDAAFIFGGQRLYIERLRDKGEHLTTAMFGTAGPLIGNVTLDAAGVAEYRKQEAPTATGSSLLELELQVEGQVMYHSDGTFTSCDVQATCPMKLRWLRLPDGTTGLELFQKVECPMNRKCSS